MPFQPEPRGVCGSLFVEPESARLREGVTSRQVDPNRSGFLFVFELCCIDGRFPSPDLFSLVSNKYCVTVRVQSSIEQRRWSAHACADALPSRRLCPFSVACFSAALFLPWCDLRASPSRNAQTFVRPPIHDDVMLPLTVIAYGSFSRGTHRSD